MASRKIHITDADSKRLREVLRVQMLNNKKDRENLRVLDEELRRAQIVTPNRIQADVVTMNSRVLIEDLVDNQDIEITLVFPEEADAATGRISVVAPMGAALLGYQAGDTVQFAVPRGRRTIRVKQVLYQPEAAGMART